MVNKYDQMQAGGVPSHQYLFSMAPKTLPIVTKLPPILVGLYVFCFFSVSFKKVLKLFTHFFLLLFTIFFYQTLVVVITSNQCSVFMSSSKINYLHVCSRIIT